MAGYDVGRAHVVIEGAYIFGVGRTHVKSRIANPGPIKGPALDKPGVGQADVKQPIGQIAINLGIDRKSPEDIESLTAGIGLVPDGLLRRGIKGIIPGIGF